MACKQKVLYIGAFMQLMCRILRVSSEVAMSMSIRHFVALVRTSLPTALVLNSDPIAIIASFLMISVVI